MPKRDWPCPWRPLLAAAAIAMAGLAACTQTTPSADPELAALIQRISQSEMLRAPEAADMMGLSAEAFGRPYGALLEGRSMAANARERTMRLDFLDQLEAIDRAALSPVSQRSLDTLLLVYRAAIAVDRHGYGYTDLGWASPYLINPQDGAYADLVSFMTLPVRSRAEAVAWLARLDQVDDALHDERRRFEVDLESGNGPPRTILQRTLARVRSLAPARPREHAMTTHFVESLAQIPDIPEADIVKFIERATVLVGGDVAAEYRALETLLEKAIPKASDQSGVWRLKDGEAYYRDALRLYTTTDLTPEDLQVAGEKLVADLTGQLNALLLELGQEDGTVVERLRALSLDPVNLYQETPEGRAELMAALEAQIKWAEARLSRIVSVAPKGKIELRQGPANSQETLSGGYYLAGTLDGLQPATYTINLRSTADVPKWRLATLSYHEAAPGHHVQAGLAREKLDLPLVNLLILSPALSEGWAVYAEDLAEELGAYETDKLAKAGYLQSLLFRAACLVADTGMHARRWTREEAIVYLTETTGLPRVEMEDEVDRHIIWPGQAATYMTGRETIRRLRRTSEQSLGQRFNLKLFHDAILQPGARPLPVLEADIAEWVVTSRPAPARPVR